MNMMKKALFSIIAIEGLILLQLLVVKGWDDMSENKKGYLMITQNKVSPVALSVTQEKKVSLSSLKETKDSLINFFSKENGFNFLYSEEVHHKMTEALERYSKSFLGRPYVWGATGPDTFDCSGFTQKIYGEWGIKIPRHSTRQAKVGQYVKYANLERGDMVFFDTEKKARGVVNHVGIYLEDGKFIHASSGNKKVVITNFNEKPFYKNRFLWGRRVVKDTILRPLPSLSQKGIEYLLSTLKSKEKRKKSYGLEANTLALASF